MVRRSGCTTGDAAQLGGDCSATRESDFRGRNAPARRSRRNQLLGTVPVSPDLATTSASAVIVGMDDRDAPALPRIV
jgi:hypothetical protein